LETWPRTYGELTVAGDRFYLTAPEMSACSRGCGEDLGLICGEWRWGLRLG
jgi:hypothetical protein